MNKIRVFTARVGGILDIQDIELESYIANNIMGLGSKKQTSIISWYHNASVGDTLRVYENLAIVKI